MAMNLLENIMSDPVQIPLKAKYLVGKKWGKKAAPAAAGQKKRNRKKLSPEARKAMWATQPKRIRVVDGRTGKAKMVNAE